MEHFEGLGDKWLALIDNPEENINGVLERVLVEGGTRDCWEVKTEKTKTMLMAWPAEGYVRAATILFDDGVDMKPYSVVPLIEGPVNDLTVQETFAWQNGLEGEVLATIPETNYAIWFYNPLFYRDKSELTEDVTYSFELAGLAYGLRRALLDEMAITEGPQFEAWAEHWLSENPEKSHLDVPPLKIPLQGTRILQAGQQAAEYQARVPITELSKSSFGPEGAQEDIYHLLVQFGVSEEHHINVLVHAPAKICLKGYEPKVGDEVDLIFWLQGRIID